MRLSKYAIVAAALLISSPVRGESFNDDRPFQEAPEIASVAPATNTLAAVPNPTAAFDALSHGSQRIALALHFAQDIDAGSKKVWTIDRIATAKEAGRSWRSIHAEMRRSGGLGDVSLGRILSHGVAAKARVRMAAARMRDALPAPSAEPGTFRTLSVQDQRIAEAVFDSQTIGPHGSQAWSLDQIATVREQGRSWRRIVNQLNAQGLVAESDINEIMDSFDVDGASSVLGRSVVVTDALGRSRNVLGR